MVNWVVVGVVVVFVVLAILIALDRWGVFQDDREGQSNGTDRVATEARREGDYSVSWMKKHKTLTLPGKAVVVSMGLLAVLTGVYIYFTLRSGAPVEVPYARQLQGGVIGVVALFAGVAVANKKAAERGKLEIVHEDDAGNAEDTEIVYYDPEETVTNADGRPVVKEHFATRILGLFGRRKLVAHDRELRSERSLLSDIVAHEIPDHATKVEENHFLFRTQGRVVKSSPSSAADYHYRSPIQLHYEQYLEQQEQLTKYRMRLNTMDSTLGEAQVRLQELQRKLKTREYRSRNEAREEIKEVLEMLPSQSVSNTVKQETSAQRHDSQTDLEDVNTQSNGGVES